MGDRTFFGNHILDASAHSEANICARSSLPASLVENASVIIPVMTLPRNIIKDSISKITALCGMVAPILFVIIFIVEGWLRYGYDPRSNFVSELSIGSGGWVQSVNFLATGSLLFMFGRGLLRGGPIGRAAKVFPLILMAMGLCLFASGFFATDPSALFNQHSVHGIIHGILGAIFFTLAPVSCFVAYKSLAGTSPSPRFKVWTMTIGWIIVIGIGFLKASQFPQSGLFEYKGLIQRIILIAYMAWVFSYARFQYLLLEP